MGNIQEGKIDWTDLKYSNDKDEIEKFKLKEGDVLFNRTNSPELVGKTAMYLGDKPAIFAGYLIRICNLYELEPKYLNICLNTYYAREFCQSVKTDGVSQSNINAQKLAKFEVPFCDRKEQKEIISRVGSLLTVIDKIEERFKKAKRFCISVDKAIFSKAFRGELVEQDPNDEPARCFWKKLKKKKISNMTFKDAAKLILREKNIPLSYRELSKLALEKKLVSDKGLTPWLTMNARF